ncbi:hypothetical protein FHS43_005353 [Streptosporangium becharense]|uniref:Uncharacterized protein n=2 Tax=Streptosporangium becharense TaxID=1816182 RepID=A0A7W9IAC3_9ACTN|nr:hypothetical protein [Streptosporangium becharense]MBB5817068.1 hypothetical protein [Streptosporangium becharense]
MLAILRGTATGVSPATTAQVVYGLDVSMGTRGGPLRLPPAALTAGPWFQRRPRHWRGRPALGGIRPGVRP